MLITKAPVCFAVRSAVLCLVPVSVVIILESGISCVLAYKILFKSALKTIAPSILANSYNLDDV